MGRVLPFIFVSLVFVAFSVADAQIRKANGGQSILQLTMGAIVGEDAPRVETQTVNVQADRTAPALPMPLPVSEAAPIKPDFHKVAIVSQPTLIAGGCFGEAQGTVCLAASD